jgi:DNA-directed RNA polymerase subunit RPC12/RpoP
MVQKFLATHHCPTCGGEFKQTRSGSFRIVCQQCGQKAQLKRKK